MKQILKIKYPKQRTKYYCVSKHTHPLYSKLGYKCKEKNCHCFNCGRSIK